MAEQAGAAPQQPADLDEAAAARTANRFDIRRIIGGLFVLYGVILIVTGVVGSDEVKNKAAGVNVDLWTGLGVLVVGLLLIAWALMRPVARVPRR
jgi:drug/metabolite transporter (DMT)-like permease